MQSTEKGGLLIDCDLWGIIEEFEVELERAKYF